MKHKAKKTIKYTAVPMPKVEVVKDFLPPPKDLVFKAAPVKIKIVK